MSLKNDERCESYLQKRIKCYNHLLNLVTRNFDSRSYKNYNRFIPSYRFITRLQPGYNRVITRLIKVITGLYLQ